MSKNISTDFKNHLFEDGLSVCTCCRIVRTDGTIFGFTSVDFGFTYEFITNADDVGPVYYTPISSFSSSSIRSDATTGVDTVELRGPTDEDYISATDLLAGRFDDAEIVIFTVKYTDLSIGEMIKIGGYIGEVTKTDKQYVIEVLSKKSRLKRYTGIVTSSSCRVKRFCNQQCKLDVSLFTSARSIDVIINGHTLTFSDSHASGYFQNGTMMFSSGANLNLEREIKQSSQLSGFTTVVLKESFPLEISVGDDFNIIMGCSRLFTFCVSLGNANNFRGEPFLPGNAVTTKVGRAPISH